MKTNRGFEVIIFKDGYEEECHLQESSACDPHIWLGIPRPELKIMYKDAIANGLNLKKECPETNEYGWCEFPIPEEVLIKSMMHLNQEQAKWLADKLNYFAETGYLEEET